VNKPSYYILVFGRIVRLTYGKHMSLREAIREQYGPPVECVFATATNQKDALKIAGGELDAEWCEVYRDENRKWAKRRTKRPQVFG
jgi:hypothetical protein